MSCHGKPSDFTTFEKLIYCGEKPEIARIVSINCNIYRKGCVQNDNIIVQCCDKGFVDNDDVYRIFEHYCRLIKNRNKLFNSIKINKEHRILWKDFIKHLRLKHHDKR